MQHATIGGFTFPQRYVTLLISTFSQTLSLIANHKSTVKPIVLLLLEARLLYKLFIPHLSYLFSACTVVVLHRVREKHSEQLLQKISMLA